MANNSFSMLSSALPFSVIDLDAAGGSFQYSNSSLTGDVGIGPYNSGDNVSQITSGTITGTVDFEGAEPTSLQSGGTVTGGFAGNDTALSTIISDITTFSSTLASETGTALTLSNGVNTITASNGVPDSAGNLVFTTTSDLGANQTLDIVGDGSGTQHVVINITSNDQQTLPTVNLSGGLTVDDVVFNYTGTGQIQSGGPPGPFNGTLIAPNTSKVNITGTTFTGHLFANGTGNIQLNSGDTFAICYLQGTRILTPTGEVCIEDLKIGDRLVTRFGGIRPIKWIGRQSYDKRFLRTNWEKLPVRIRAGALADHMPARDLYISPGHSMLVEDQLVLARSLVNGVTITQDDAPDHIHYHQIEFETHDCVLAEGAWSESFADGDGLRSQFHNESEFWQLYPDHKPVGALCLCAPRPASGPALDKALRPVLARLPAVMTPGSLRNSVDLVTPSGEIAGWAQDVSYPDLPVLLEVLYDGELIGTVLACDFRDDLLVAGIGRGRCAFSFASPVPLDPKRLDAVKVRRASDGLELTPTDDCKAIISTAQVHESSAANLAA